MRLATTQQQMEVELTKMPPEEETFNHLRFFSTDRTRMCYKIVHVENPTGQRSLTSASSREPITVIIEAFWEIDSMVLTPAARDEAEAIYRYHHRLLTHVRITDHDRNGMALYRVPIVEGIVELVSDAEVEAIERGDDDSMGAHMGRNF